MIKINDPNDGGSERNGRRMTTITMPEKFDERRDLYRFQPHEVVIATPLPFADYPPGEVANETELPRELRKQVE